MDVYRRLTRCNQPGHAATCWKQDMKDAFGEPRARRSLLLALTELRLLAGMFGIESIIRKDPDVVLTVRDASQAQAGLIGAPGTLRVIDEKTIYLRMPGSFNESDTLLMVLRNLLKAAHEREVRGEPPPAPKGPTAPARRGRLN